MASFFICLREREESSLSDGFYCLHLQDCMYLHELGDGAGSFTKDDMQAGLVIFSFLFIFLACSSLVLIFRNRTQTQQLC